MDRRFYLIFSIFIGLVFVGCTSTNEDNTFEVRRQDFEQYTAFVGSLESASQHPISPPYYGKVLWIEQEGKAVKKGDILIKLDTDEIKAEHEGNILDLESQQNNMELFILKGEYNEYSYKRDVTMKKISYEEALSSYRTAFYGLDTEEIEHKNLNIQIREREIVRVEEILSSYEEYMRLGYVSDDDRKNMKKIL